MKPVRERVIRVTFNADVHSSLQWNFRPQQSEIYVSGTLTWNRAHPDGAAPGSASLASVTLIPICESGP